MNNNIFKYLLIATISTFLAACASPPPPMSLGDQPQPGFSNVKDIAIPKSAQIDIDRSTIMGGSTNWTGHLVYTVNRPRVTTIDFLSTNMVQMGWAKISELRGSETVIVFMKDKRVATFRIIGSADKSIVTVDMANSNAKHIIEEPQTAPKTQSFVVSPQQQ